MKRFWIFALLLLCLTCFAQEESQSLVLPSDLTVIGEAAFEGCSAVTSVTIPTGTQVIEAGAFAKCLNLTDVYFYGTREQWEAISIGDNNAPLTEAVFHCREPLLYLTSIPAYGEGKNVEGVVCMGDGSPLDTSLYRVTAFIYVDPYGWYIKPTSANPCVKLDKNGYFTLDYDTGGEADQKCAKIEVLLLPADYNPPEESPLEPTRAAALDSVMITRSADGTVTCSPNRRLGQAYEYHNKSLNLTAGSKLALDVGLFLNGETTGSTLSESTIRARLQAIQPYCDTVRFYGAGSTTYQRAYTIANEMGFTVIGGAWLSGDTDADKAELNALVSLCNSGKCAMACVGSETLYRNELTVSELVSYIEDVRARIPSSIPVTTADSIDIIMSSAYLQASCDLFYANCYPYWGGVSVEDALSAFTSSVASLRSCDETKQILISETGWPTAGATVGSAVPNLANAAAYFEDIRSWSVSTGTPVFYFEAFDEKWKKNDGKECEAHFGIWDGNLSLKDEFDSLSFFN